MNIACSCLYSCAIHTPRLFAFLVLSELEYDVGVNAQGCFEIAWKKCKFFNPFCMRSREEKKSFSRFFFALFFCLTLVEIK